MNNELTLKLFVIFMMIGLPYLRHLRSNNENLKKDVIFRILIFSPFLLGTKEILNFLQNLY